MKLVSVLLAASCMLSAVSAQWLETTVPLPDSSGPLALCYNPQNNKVCCSNQHSGNVTVIDGATNSVLATVPVESMPFALCYNPQNNKVYCANYGSGNVTVIDGATNGVLATVPVGRWPDALCYDAQNNRVYCANYDSYNVTVIDGASNQVVTTIGVGDEPIDMVWNSAQNRMYVADYGSSSISVIRDSMAGGIEEATNYERRTPNPGPTIVRGVLYLPCRSDFQVANRGRDAAPTILLDATGREIMGLKPGPNDVSRLSPGVYFLLSDSERKGKVSKLVLAH